MIKKWFDFGLNGDRASAVEPLGPSPENHGLALEATGQEGECSSGRRFSEDPATSKLPTFEQIYQHAAVRPPQISFGILKVIRMADSPYLTGMTPEAKRCALLMALEASGAEIEDLLQDAIVRQRALHEYEEEQQDQLRDFETAKTEDIRMIRADLDRITAQHMSRIQANLDAVVRQQETVHGWQARKQEECQRIAEAAAFLVSQEGPNHHRMLTAVLERTAAGSRR